ncbi:MAG TPA: hypothetical protein VGV93_03410 [Acidimicrobiales bacterium]|nr:hypothetical protein [Acidimicrobiales bacterium]
MGQVAEITEPTPKDGRAKTADLHLPEPPRLLRPARAAGVLPERVLVVRCRPQTCEAFEERLSRHVAAAVPVTAHRVHGLIDEILVELR